MFLVLFFYGVVVDLGRFVEAEGWVDGESSFCFFGWVLRTLYSTAADC